MGGGLGCGGRSSCIIDSGHHHLFQAPFKSLRRHGRIIVALMMREIMTRFGRQGLGFLWLVGEPLLFCLGVVAMWTVIKPPYEHGIRVGAFVMTGYMCLLLLRHQIAYCLHAVGANTGLLYHRQVRPIHIYASRGLLEFAGSTLAFAIVYAILLAMGQVGLPQDLGLLYTGWATLGLLSFGMGLTMSALAMRYETFERLTQLLTYLLIPLSGAFFMASAVPSQYRDQFLLIPLPHTVEMVRAGIFGEFVETHYNPIYPLAWAGGLIFLGLLLLSVVRNHIDVE